MIVCRTCGNDDVIESEYNVAQLQCKICVATYSKQYRLKNAITLKARSVLYYKENKKSIDSKNKANHEKNKKEHNSQKKIYYQLNKTAFLNRAKEYTANNEKKTKEYLKQYREDNKGKANTHRKNRMLTDALFKLSTTLRSRTCVAFKRKDWIKDYFTYKLLGTDYETAKKHVESFFTEGMNWDNHGEWHIDHHIALASATTKEELIKLCHFENLRPLWKIDNLKKGAKLNWSKT